MKSLHLSSRQRRQLEKQLKSARDVRVYRRTLAVLEFGRGRSVTEISRTLRVSRPSVYRWIERFLESPASESLRDEERAGRPPVWTEECSEWRQTLASAPSEARVTVFIDRPGTGRFRCGSPLQRRLAGSGGCAIPRKRSARRG